MRKLMNKRAIMATVAVAAVLGTVGAAWAVPQVSDVVMAQRPNSRFVDISYELSGEAAIVTLGIETNGVAIPDSAVTLLSGDVCKEVRPGSRSIVWNAGADWPENLTQDAKAKVTAWSTNAPPQVMVIDLREGASADNYPVNYYVNTAALPYGGLTNSIYKNSRLVMRKINNGAFTMGEGAAAKEVILSQDFYTGVFQVTQGQWAQVMNDWPSYRYNINWRLTRPVERVSYFDIRENPSGDGSAINPNWPQSDAVGADSFMGKLRSKTGLATFDLPTEAQWEYACRAGTEGEFNDDSLSADLDARLNLLGRYALNGGRGSDGESWPPPNCTAEYATALVGSYAPNAWGLYDMHGNVWEWCLDWHASSLPGGFDPKGADSGSDRVLRGGCWYNPASYCRSAFRYYADSLPSYRYDSFGFRLVRTLPAR